MLSDIVQRVLAESPDLDVITWPNGLERLMDIPAEHHPDVVVTGLGPAQGIEPFVSLLHAQPSLRILALEGNGRGAVMYELQPHAVPLGDVSPDGLIDAIRSAGRVRHG
jgi:hypothetical protein